MRIISFIVEPDTIHRILSHLGEPTTIPEIAPARDPPQIEFNFSHLELEEIYFPEIDLRIVPERPQEAGDPFPYIVDPPHSDETGEPIYNNESDSPFTEEQYIEPEQDYDQTVSW